MQRDYLQGIAKERRRIKTLLELDLLLLEKATPEELVERAIQLIDKEPLLLDEGCDCTTCDCSSSD